MPELTTFTKDPDAILDYVWDWTAWLNGDTIATATVTVAEGLTVDTPAAVVGPLVTVWLSGGTAGTTYAATCRIVTDGGRTDDRTSRILVMER